MNKIRLLQRTIGTLLLAGLGIVFVLFLVAQAHTYDPITALVWNGFYQADLGVTGTNVTAWASQEGGATLVYSPGDYGVLTASQFGTQPGIYFSQTANLKHSSPLTGNTGYVIAYVRMGTLSSGSAQGAWGVNDKDNSTVDLVTGDVVEGGAVWNGPGTQQRRNDTKDRVYSLTTTISSNSTHIVEWWSDGADYFYAVDGVTGTNTISTGSDSGDWWADSSNLDTLYVGNGSCSTTNCIQGLIGSIGVIGFISGSVPTADERTDLRDWVLNHWDSVSPDPTATFTPTPTFTPTATFTPTPTGTPTPVDATPTPTPSPTPTPTPTTTPTPTPTFTPTSTPVVTPTPTRTSTPVPITTPFGSPTPVTCNGFANVYGWTGLTQADACGQLSTVQKDAGTYSYLMYRTIVLNTSVNAVSYINQIAAASYNDVFSQSVRTYYEFNYDWHTFVGMGFFDYKGRYISGNEVLSDDTVSAGTWVLLQNLDRTAPPGTTFVQFWYGIICTSAISCTPYHKTYIDTTIATTGILADTNTLLTSPGFEDSAPATPTPTPTFTPTPTAACDTDTTLKNTACKMSLDSSLGRIAFIIGILLLVVIAGAIAHLHPFVIAVLGVMVITGFTASLWIAGTLLVTIVIIGGLLFLFKIVTGRDE